MLKNIHWKYYIKCAVIAAILYCIPVFFFLRTTTWSHTWLLYFGNALFMITLAGTLLGFNRRRGGSASSMSMVLAGLITTILGIIISIAICLLLLSVMIPGLYNAGTPDKLLSGEPVNSVPDRSRGPVYLVLFNAFMGNVSTGLFVCIIFPFTLKDDQTKEETLPGQPKV
ncbi:MAG TPA: hypothetical protein VHC96_18240 [Puia sp.]|nr:hypothetical protein [Puia sp.]